MGYETNSLYDRIVDKWTALEPKMKIFNNSRDMIAQYFRADLDIETKQDDTARGSFLGRGIYEGTAAWALHVAATGLRGNTVSESIPWINYRMKQYELRGIDALDTYCQSVEEYMIEVYRNSNFYQVQQRFTKDALSIGSPVMFIEENNPLEGIIKCLPIHYKNARVIYNEFNEPDGIIILDNTWTAKQIFDHFCKGKTLEERKKQIDSKLSNVVKYHLESGDDTKEFPVIRAVFRADDPIFDIEGFKKPEPYFKWVSVYFEYQTPKTAPQGNQGNTPLETSGYYSRPFVVWDYDKPKHDPISRTPCYYAIYDVLSQQEVQKQLLENVRKKNRPPIVAMSEMMNRLKLYPGGITEATDESEYDRPPKPIELIGEVLYNKDLSAQLGEAIKRHLHIDQYVMFAEIARMNKQPLTALQIAQIMGEKATLLSPEIETQSRYLNDVDARFMSIEAEAGRGPFAPSEIANIIDIVSQILPGPIPTIGIVPQFVGTLNKAQKIQQQLAPIDAGLDIIAKHAQVLGPSVTRAIKPYQSLDAALTAVGYPMAARTEEDEFNELIAADMQAEMQQAGMAQAAELMKASKGITGPVDPDSILANAGKAMQEA